MAMVKAVVIAFTKNMLCECCLRNYYAWRAEFADNSVTLICHECCQDLVNVNEMFDMDVALTKAEPAISW